MLSNTLLTDKHRSNSESQDIATAATIATLDSTKSFVRFTGAIATELQGVTAPTTLSPEILILENASSVNITIKHQSGTADAANQIETLDQDDVFLAPSYAAKLIYNSSTTKWRLLSIKATSEMDKFLIDDATNPLTYGGGGESSELVAIRYATEVLQPFGASTILNFPTKILETGGSYVTDSSTNFKFTSPKDMLMLAVCMIRLSIGTVAAGSWLAIELHINGASVGIFPQLLQIASTLGAFTPVGGTMPLDLKANDVVQINLISSGFSHTLQGQLTQNWISLIEQR